MPKQISLSEARKKKRLKQFIDQESKRLKKAAGDPGTLLEKAIKAPKSKRRTSHSPNGNGSRGK